MLHLLYVLCAIVVTEPCTKLLYLEGCCIIKRKRKIKIYKYLNIRRVIEQKVKYFNG